MDKLINASLKLNKMWKSGERNVRKQPQFEKLMKQFPLPFPVTKFEKKFPSTISIKTLYMYGGLRVSIYLIPKNKIMQAHNHPDMFVLGHLMAGKTKMRQYTHVKDNLYKKIEGQFNKHDTAVIDSNENNIHEFEALQNSVLFDILFPDYDDERPGQLFKEVRKVGDLYELAVDQYPNVQLEEIE